jgi:enoyl-CoA hydratase/carnithine racemase
MSDRVTITIEDGIADVRLNRPEKLNALDPAMFRGIVDAGESLKGNPLVRAVVLSGEGRSFCAGLDLAGFRSMAAADPQRTDADGAGSIMQTDGRHTHLGQQAVWVWQELEVPVIAAVSGHALGGGLQVALGADLRIVAPDAKLSVLEIRWGLVPDMVGTLLLPRLVGPERAKELTFTGRTVGGEEAVRIGLACEVAEEPRRRAMELAAELATKSPDALAHAKRLINASGTRPWTEQLADERTTMAGLIASPNQVEAVTAYLEQRPARFERGA